MKPTKIALGVVCYRIINPKTYLCLARLIANSKAPILPLMEEGCNQLENRERLVRKAQNEQCTHLLFIDSDMYFESDILEKLMAHDKDIVGAEYAYRELPRRSVIKSAANVTITEIPKELFKCYSIGGGLVLIKMSVFNKIETPWFHMPATEYGSTAMGHDVFFCQQARKAGYEIWCDPTLSIGHIGDYRYD